MRRRHVARGAVVVVVVMVVAVVAVVAAAVAGAIALAVAVCGRSRASGCNRRGSSSSSSSSSSSILVKGVLPTCSRHSAVRALKAFRAPGTLGYAGLGLLGFGVLCDVSHFGGQPGMYIDILETLSQTCLANPFLHVFYTVMLLSSDH